jgi:hypothetical protein
MSWPFSPGQCPSCRYFQALEPPAFDDAGYEIVRGCLDPRIAMELFRFKERNPEEPERCPRFVRLDDRHE